MRVFFAAIMAGLAGGGVAQADIVQPQPLPLPAPIAPPQDTPYAGTIRLAVDATDLDRHILSVHETLPVQHGGDLALLYPRWIPGEHGPSGPLRDLAGLVVRSHGQLLPWVRDVVDINAFHVQVPDSATSLDIAFQFLSPPDDREGRVIMTPEMLDLSWDKVVLYPAGYFSRDISVAASLTLPGGWKLGTALENSYSNGITTGFKTTTLNTLVDSPVFAGRYFSSIDLDPGAAVPVHLDIVADRPEDLAITPAQLAMHRALVQQAYKNYGSHHYDHYDFLLSLSGTLSGEGLEHHRSSENAVDRPYFTDWDGSMDDHDLLPHEFTHSWNGKFRRPADLWAPNFNVPERDSLLWVYEGQTQYWGKVLAARSGLWTLDQAHDAIAGVAAYIDGNVGRSWRALQDTTNDPIINNRAPLPWSSYQRAEDYYDEGLLIWLDADTLIREMSNGQRSLSDFARGFFGINDGSFVTSTYNFDDVVHALNAVQPYDWAKFLRTRLDGNAQGAPLDGLARGGYRLVYTDTESAFGKSVDGAHKKHDFRWSVGLVVGKDGEISGVQWNSPAFKAGIALQTKIIAVNGLAYEDADDLASAIKLAKTTKTGKPPIEILLQDGEHFRTVHIDYHGGLRYPHLERIQGKPALLDDILAPMK